MKRPSQNERILELLGDGRWHSHHELYALHCIFHSRKSELAERGYEIEQRRITVNGKPVWEYRLIGEVEAGADLPGESSRVSGHSAPASTSSLCATQPEPPYPTQNVSGAVRAGLVETTHEEIAESAPAPQTFPYLGADATEQLTLDAA